MVSSYSWLERGSVSLITRCRPEGGGVVRMISGVTVREEASVWERSSTHTYPRALRPVAVGFWTRFAVFALEGEANLPPFLPPLAVVAVVALVALLDLLALLAAEGVVVGAPE